MNTETLRPSEEVSKLMQELKEECHSFIDSMFSETRPNHAISYESAKNTWLFFKLAQMQEQINQLKIQEP